MTDTTGLIVQYINGEPAGTMSLTTISYAYTSTTSGTWTYQIEQFASAVTGTLNRGVTIMPEPTGVTGLCSTTDYSFPDQSLSLGSNPDPWGWQEITTNVDPGEGRMCEGWWTFQYMVPGGAITTPITFYAEPVRCDNGLLPGYSNRGCVFPDFEPTLTYSRQEFPEFTHHIDSALDSGLWGSEGTGPLTRMTDSSDISRNREAAVFVCGAWGPLPAGKQCDEYPFASTYEGAYMGGFSDRPRSLAGCNLTVGASAIGPNGFSVCGIDGTENTTAGSQLNSFYVRNRILDSDGFYVDTAK